MKAILIMNHEMQVQVDGELLGIAPVSVKIIPKALNVFVASVP